jgi:pSer/pThr/pTyr-binding forkhead associated (FHA) protein
VPALYRLSEADERGRRYALIPEKAFSVGRDIDCDVIVADPSVSRRHAHLRRESHGYVIRDLGSSYGCYVNGMRVRRPVVLKSGDRIKLGKVTLEFSDPFNIEKEAQRETALDVVRQLAPEPIVDALLAIGDRRVALLLLERMMADPVGAGEVEQLNRLLGEETGRLLSEKLAKKSKRTRIRTPLLLFSITAENLGKDVPAWLAWWDRVKASQPTQVASERPPQLVRLRVLSGEAASTGLALDDEGGVFQIGRDAACALRLSNRTVSRLHATIYRLHRCWVIRDDGSRLGTLVNEERVGIALVNPGDIIKIGSVEMILELQEDADQILPSAGIGLYAIDPGAFDALVALEHKSVVTGLLTLLQEHKRLEWAQWSAAALHPASDADATRLVKVVTEFYTGRREVARELLPKLLGSEVESDWGRLLAQRRTSLGPQVLPLGWVAASRGLHQSSPAAEATQQ